MSFINALQEIHSIGEEKLNSGDYLVMSNHLKTIYETTLADQALACQQSYVIQPHIIRKYDRVLSEDDQINKRISFALTVEEQFLVMRDRFRRYYETELTELALSIVETTELLKQTRELKREFYLEYTYFRGKDNKIAHKSACMRERNLNADIAELKNKLGNMTRDMEDNLNPR